MPSKQILYIDRTGRTVNALDAMDITDSEGLVPCIQIGPVRDTGHYLTIDEDDIPTVYNYLRSIIQKYSLLQTEPNLEPALEPGTEPEHLDLPVGWHHAVRTDNGFRRVRLTDDIEVSLNTATGWAEFSEHSTGEGIEIPADVGLDALILNLMKLRGADGRVTRTIAEFEVRLSEVSHRGGSSIWNVSVRDKLVGSITQSSTTGEVRETSPRWETSPQGTDLGSFANEQAAAIWLLYREGYYSQKRALTLIEELER